jgi:hypothetical protein
MSSTTVFRERSWVYSVPLNIHFGTVNKWGYDRVLPYTSRFTIQDCPHQILPKLRYAAINKYAISALRKAVGTVACNWAVDCVWNVMAQAQKPDFVFRRNGRVYLNRRGRQVSRLLAAEVCATAVVMLDTPCSEVVWRALATHSIRQFHLHFHSRGSPCAITFQLDSTTSAAISLSLQQPGNRG